MASTGQQSFDFPPGEGESRRRRYRRRRPSARPASAGRDQPLTQTPITRRCGFCGHHQTILQDVALCDQCGGLIDRYPDSDR
jgi:ribosomal protein S14